jgi:hypothetical protein
MSEPHLYLAPMHKNAPPAATIPGMAQIGVSGNREQFKGFSVEHPFDSARVGSAGG